MSTALASPHATVQASEFRQGWPVVLACFCTATFAWGFGFYGQSVYLAELQHARGWPASLIASGHYGYTWSARFCWHWSIGCLHGSARACCWQAVR